jgi:hypothetical protein
MSLSAWLNQAFVNALAVEDDLIGVAEWEAEYGPPSADALAAADAVLDAASIGRGPRASRGVNEVTYDAGALIAAERGSISMWLLHRRLLEREVRPTLSTTAARPSLWPLSAIRCAMSHAAISRMTCQHQQGRRGQPHCPDAWSSRVAPTKVRHAKRQRARSVRHHHRRGKRVRKPATVRPNNPASTVPTSVSSPSPTSPAQPTQPSAPACQTPPLPTLPSGTGETSIIGGIFWLAGGPSGECQPTASTPLGGTITVKNAEGVTVATVTVAEGETFDIAVSPGTYTVTGVREVPMPLPLTCGAAAGSDTFAAGQPVPVSQGQSVDVYCAGDIP